MTDHNFNSNHQVTSFETFTFEELGFNTFDVEIIRAMFKSKHGIERAKFFFGWQNTLYRTARNICTRKFSTHYVPDIAFAKIM